MKIGLIVGLIGSFSWVAAYILIAWRGYKDISYGMPLVPLALNFSFEITFSFIYPLYLINAFSYINFVWLAIDSIIVYTFLKNGYKYFKNEFNSSKTEFYFLFILAFSTAFLIMIYGGIFFRDMPFCKGNMVESSILIALIQSIAVSVCFVLMFMQRRTCEGQSFLIGFLKFIGTPLVGINYLLHHSEPFLYVLYLIIFIFDVWYIILIYQQLKKEGHNPWIRI